MKEKIKGFITYILSLYERVVLCLNTALSVCSNHLHLFLSHLFLQVQKLAELLLPSFMLRVVTGNLQTLHPCPTRRAVSLCRVTCSLYSPRPPETGETRLKLWGLLCLHWVLCLNLQRPFPAPPTVWFSPATHFGPSSDTACGRRSYGQTMQTSL